jgi:hypothetical protein
MNHHRSQLTQSSSLINHVNNLWSDLIQLTYPRWSISLNHWSQSPIRPPESLSAWCQHTKNESVAGSQSQSQSHVTADGQSASQSWCRAPSGTHGQIFSPTHWLFGLYSLGGAPSLTRGWVCHSGDFSCVYVYIYQGLTLQAHSSKCGNKLLGNLCFEITTATSLFVRH